MLDPSNKALLNKPFELFVEETHVECVNDVDVDSVIKLAATVPASFILNGLLLMRHRRIGLENSCF